MRVDVLAQHFCNNTGATWWTPWTTIKIGDPVAPQTEYPQGTWNYFRLYVPQDHSCDYALRLLAPSASGGACAGPPRGKLRPRPCAPRP